MLTLAEGKLNIKDRTVSKRHKIIRKVPAQILVPTDTYYMHVSTHTYKWEKERKIEQLVVYNSPNTNGSVLVTLSYLISIQRT